MTLEWKLGCLFLSWHCHKPMIKNLNSPKIITAEARRRLEREGILEACRAWEENMILKERREI